MWRAAFSLHITNLQMQMFVRLLAAHYHRFGSIIYCIAFKFNALRCTFGIQVAKVSCKPFETLIMILNTEKRKKKSSEFEFDGGKNNCLTKFENVIWQQDVNKIKINIYIKIFYDPLGSGECHSTATPISS